MSETIDILERIKSGGCYSSTLYDEWSKTSLAEMEAKGRLQEEMGKVLEIGTEYANTLSEEPFEKKYSWSDGIYTTNEVGEFNHTLDEAFSELCYETGLMRSGTSFWENSSC